MLGLTVGMGLDSVNFRITRVAAGHGRATVDALANGAPGGLVLVEEGSRYRVLALEGA